MISLFPNSQTFLSINIGGNLDIRWYAVLILFGAFLTFLVSRSEFKRAKYTDLDFFESLFIYSLWIGIIGARLWFCAFYNLDYYLANPSAIIRIWDGGLAIQGGLVAGVIFAFIYCKVNRYPFLKILDIILPNVLIGQAFGRWGNYLNKECHGGEVAETYFDGILSFLKEGMHIDGHYYEPLFFYESMLCIIGWAIIYLILRKRQNKRGDLAYCYLMWYGVIRFFIEGRRTDSLYLGNFRMAQLTSIAFVILGALGYIGIFRKVFKSSKPTLIFDFDGTLVDTSGSIREAYRECFKKYSNEKLFTSKVQNEVLGPALKDIFPKYFPDYDYDTVYATYRAKQKEVQDKLNHPTPNAVETLKTLHEQGYKIGIVSTRTKEGIEELLEQFKMDKYIDDICGLKDVTNLKPNPEGIIMLINKNKWNKDCVMIGDSLMDIECGRNYGALTVGYLDNRSRLNQMKEASDATIDDLDQLLSVLAADIDFTYNKL